MKTVFFILVLIVAPAAGLTAQVAQGITIGSGTIFSLGGATLSLPNHWANSGTFNAGTGSVVFNGPSDYQLITNAYGETFQNLTVNKASSYVLLNGNVTVNGSLTLTKGDFNTNGHAVTMGPGAFLSETEGNTVLGSGTVTATAILNAPSGTNVCGLGATLTSVANLGSTIVRRGHMRQSVGNDSSVLRYYDIIPTNNTGLNAALTFHYDVSELNGLSDATLCLYRSTDGGNSWQEMGGIVNTAARTISLSAIDAFSRWTLAAKHTVIAPSDAPALASPASGATNQPVSLVLRWQRVAGAESYQCQVSADRSWDTPAVNDSTLNDTSKQVSLQSMTQYYWRVRAQNSGGVGPFSVIDSFTTIIAAPAQPVLASPADNAVGVSGTVTFRWHPAARAATYRLQVSVDTQFTSFAVHDSTLTDTTKQVGQLASGRKYYWRANATNIGGTGSWSTVRGFTTSTTSVDELEGVPTEFALLQNYPNPFNPSTVIRYDLPQTSYVKISIYDMLGREVAKLADQVQHAGKYKIEWRASDLSGGLYFCRIRTAEFSAVRKMIMLK